MIPMGTLTVTRSFTRATNPSHLEGAGIFVLYFFVFLGLIGFFFVFGKIKITETSAAGVGAISPNGRCFCLRFMN